MVEYFADAWFFIARLDRFDPHHQAAGRIVAAIRGDRLITHDGVVLEVLAFFSHAGVVARTKAAEWAREARLLHRVLSLDGQRFSRGLDLYARRPDKEYSLTDCISMVVMRDRGITHVLTNDHHFRQEGFIVVNE